MYIYTHIPLQHVAKCINDRSKQIIDIKTKQSTKANNVVERTYIILIYRYKRKNYYLGFKKQFFFKGDTYR